MGKFWNGDVRLVKAYWIYGLLLPNGVFLLLWLSGLELVPGSATAILFGTTILAYLVFWGVGTWRSATKYTGPKVWAILTKIHLALPLVGLILAIAIPALWSSKVKQSGPAQSSSATVDGRISPISGAQKYSVEVFESANMQGKTLQQTEPSIAPSPPSQIENPIHASQDEKAILILQRSVQANPNDEYAWNTLGLIYQRNGQQSSAVEAYKQVVHIAPTRGSAWKELGVVYHQSGQNANAIEAFKQAMRINPTDEDALYHLGLVYKTDAQMTEFVNVFRRLKELNPTKAEKLFNSVP